MPRDTDKDEAPVRSAPLWSVPLAIDDVPETGSHVSLEADDAVRASVGKAAGLRDLPSFKATFDVARRARGVEVTGRVEATVGQTCVVTLEPIESQVKETIAMEFAPPGDPAFAEAEPPEPLVDGVIDLGAIAVEFLMLGIDPYPRKKGVEFVSPDAPDVGTSPFSALEKLKKSPSTGS
jgi:hypothetical protein